MDGCTDRIRLTGLLRKSPASAGLFYVRWRYAERATAGVTAWPPAM